MSSPAWNRRRRWKRWEAASAFVWKVMYDRGRDAPAWYPTKESYWATHGTKAKKLSLK